MSRGLGDVYKRQYLLKVKFSRGKHNLLRLLDLLKEQEIGFGGVHSELPTLNDVFLEITGKALRD